jgi:hypothetical protein
MKSELLLAVSIKPINYYSNMEQVDDLMNEMAQYIKGFGIRYEQTIPDETLLLSIDIYGDNKSFNKNWMVIKEIYGKIKNILQI